MAYWVEDRNGYVGDLASGRGLRHLAAHGPRALKRFLKHGGTIDAGELANVVTACRASSDRDVKKVATLLRHAVVPVMVTDGTESNNPPPPEPPPPPPPDPHAPVQYSEKRVIAYLDNNNRPVTPHFATRAKVWTPDGRVTIISLTDEAAHGNV